MLRVLGKSTSINVGYMTPFAHPDLPAVAAYYDWLGQREARRRHGRNGVA